MADNAIALGVKGAESSQTNPLALIETLTKVQNQSNQNRQFQQTFAARKRAGEILSQSSDLESGLNDLYHDPLTAPFAGDVINSIRTGQQTQADIQGKQQTQAMEGLNGLFKALPGAIANPGILPDLIDGYKATLSPSAAGRLEPVFKNLKNMLSRGMTGDQANDSEMFKRNLSGIASAAGVSPEVFSVAAGKPDMIDVGNQKIPVMRNQATGQVTQSGNPLALSMTPAEAATPVQFGVNPDQSPKMVTKGSLAGGGAGAHEGQGPDGVQGAPSPYYVERVKDFGKYETALDDQILSGQQNSKNIDAIVEAASKAKMGGGAEAYLKLGQAMQAIGLDNDVINKWAANGDIAASTVIDKLSLNNSMQQLRQQLQGVAGSRMNMQEFIAYMQKNPNLATDPEAAMQIFGLWKQAYDRSKTEQRMLDKYKSGKPTGDELIDKSSEGKADLTRWPMLWAQSDYMNKYAPSKMPDTSKVKINTPTKPGDKPPIDSFFK